MGKGQAAIEYLALVGFVLMFAVPVVIQMQESAGAMERSTEKLQVSNTLDAIDESASLVYSQGEPARVTFTADIPKRVDETNVTDNYVRIRYQDPQGASDFIRLFSFNVSGNIPTTAGKHTMVAEAVGRSNVTINTK